MTLIDSKPKVYFDTNALNFLCDTYRGRSKSPFRNFNIFLSWPLVDEIECNSSFARTIELADFVWSVSNRKILCTLKDLVSIEVLSLLNNITLSLPDYFDSDKSYIKALKRLLHKYSNRFCKNDKMTSDESLQCVIHILFTLSPGEYTIPFSPMLLSEALLSFHFSIISADCGLHR